MCRILAYLGPAVTLESLLLAPTHSLLRQSWAPRLQRWGTINADGFGAGWYDRSRRPEPARYRTTRPMWADRSFASLSGITSSGAVLAAVRSATPPAPVEESGTAPFTEGPWLFAHNGAVDGFCDGRGAELRHQLSDRRSARIEGASDSEVLFALALDALDAGATLGQALTSVVTTVLAVTPARLNLVLTDGYGLAATAWGDSLFSLQGRDLAKGGVIVASEPSDDGGGWDRVPDRSLVEASAECLKLSPLDAGTPS